MFDAPIYICVQNMAFRIVIGIILYAGYRSVCGRLFAPQSSTLA
jgi:hypothetical protein